MNNYPIINSPYAKHPEGSRNSGLYSIQTFPLSVRGTFGTVGNISY